MGDVIYLARADMLRSSQTSTPNTWQDVVNEAAAAAATLSAQVQELTSSLVSVNQLIDAIEDATLREFLQKQAFTDQEALSEAVGDLLVQVSKLQNAGP
jgi:hypothetical protein